LHGVTPDRFNFVFLIYLGSDWINHDVRR
jgi:hypothetical protein